MNDFPTSLDDYSDEQIAAEYARRFEMPRKKDPPEPRRFCDECVHFVPFHGDRLDDTRRLCARGHRSKFCHPPQGTPEDRFGFYRRRCADFARADGDTGDDEDDDEEP